MKKIILQGWKWKKVKLQERKIHLKLKYFIYYQLIKNHDKYNFFCCKMATIKIKFNPTCILFKIPIIKPTLMVIVTFEIIIVKVNKHVIHINL